MDRFKLHDLRCFDAVAVEGSFQAAAVKLGRSHPSVFAAVAKLEQALGLLLLDRSGYRVALTDAGRMFHERAAATLGDFDRLQSYAGQLASGEETVLRIVIGDICPRPPILRLLSGFFAGHLATRLHLEYAAVGGPLERLSEGDADLIFHHVESSDPRFEHIGLCDVAMVPVVAPDFLPLAPSAEITPDMMRPFTQCVIRDTARSTASDTYFLIDGAHRCSVPDHAMKKELILHGLAWGHLPAWLIEQELRTGELISIASPHLPGLTNRLSAIRLRQAAHGPIANQLWSELHNGLAAAL